MDGNRPATKDHLLLQAMLRGDSQVEAARASGLSERTVRRRLTDPVFSAALRAARDETTRRTSDALAGAAERAVTTLTELVDDRSVPPAVRRSAARDLLQLSVRAREQVDLVDRLEELEIAIAGGQ